MDRSEKFRILLSRTDSIGDVVLTLPMAGWIKKHFPQAEVFFLGRTYTRDVIQLSEHITAFVNADDLEAMPQQEAIAKIRTLQLDVIVHVFPNSKFATLAKAAEVALRVGTTNRIFHWWTCNTRIALSRKNSSLHEAQLNLKLLNFFKIPTDLSLSELSAFYGFQPPSILPLPLPPLGNDKKRIILHPRSKGSAREWGLPNFLELILLLPAERFQILISGTSQDAATMQDFLAQAALQPHVIDITGKLNLQEFISCIASADALVAASTGPLHIAAALGKQALGLFSPRRPIHPGRWAPLGTRASALVFDADCTRCSQGEECDCITQIKPQRVADLLLL
jgi:ADP-heptose:LPS heptosyltransferase